MDCFKAGLQHCALTDHNTVGGWPAFQSTAIQLGLSVTLGVELTTSYKSIEYHLLGYFSNPTYYPFLNNKLVLLKQKRIDWICQILNKIKEAGIYISDKDNEFLNNAKSISRTHIAKLLVNNGLAKNTQEAFNNYLFIDKPFYIERPQNMSFKEASSLIHKHNGISILAHYPRYPNNDIFNTIIELRNKYGLMGIETFYDDYDAITTFKTIMFARKTGLLMSAGSDFHGLPNKSIIGTYFKPKDFLQCIEPFLNILRI